MTPQSPISPRLLSRGVSISGGRAFIHGVAVSELAEEFGTPLFIYDAEHIRAEATAAVQAAEWQVAYASKAFLCRELARVMDSLGVHMDVASGGELHVALSAGFDPARIVFHGNNKSEAEIAYGVSTGVGLFVVDSLAEISRLERAAEAARRRQPVLVRVTPGVEAHTHEYIMTGQEDSKFGFSVASGAAEVALRAVASSRWLDYQGIHAHIGSQIFLLDSYAKEVDALADLVRAHPPRILNLGGGLGVAYVAGEENPGFEAWAAQLYAALERNGVDRQIRIMVEPGRSLVAQSAMTVYRVGTIKRLEGLRTYVSVDGGMSDNPRPVLYGSGYEAFMPDAADSERDQVATVVGKHCESGDVLIRDAWIPSSLAEGDLLATPVTGAYGYSMASNYNRVPRPPVVFVDAEGARLAVRGESFEDMVRLDV
ncbi:MAG: diaminopimelate decarboxylase [Actinomycetota bacterium]|nr:diaminopimelate decarboxylase [Actinomycetota bacterium]